MNFVKMQANGNDYIYIDLHKQSLPDPRHAAIRLSARHTGVGGDGLVLLEPSECADFRMRILDPDGTEAEMCGNALQSAGVLYAYTHNVHKKRLQVETLAGKKQVFLEWAGDHITSVCAEIGSPQVAFIGKKETICGLSLALTSVSFGNPHCVVLTDNLSDEQFLTLGPALEHHPLFPHRTNVEFVSVTDRCHFRMRTWERGCGETLSCATGSAAALVAAVIQGAAEPEAIVQQPGGSIRARWDQAKNALWIYGNTQIVFQGSFSQEWLDTGSPDSRSVL